MKAPIRALRGRAWALAGAALAVAVAAAFAALATDAWTTALPRAAAQDVRDSPENGVLVSVQISSGADLALKSRLVNQAIAAAGPAGIFDVSAIDISHAFDLDQSAVAALRISGSGAPAAPASSSSSSSSSSSASAAPVRQTFAVSRTAVAGNAVLVSGSWPSGPEGPGGTGVIPVALPQTTLSALGLHVGSKTTLWNSSNGSPLGIDITGAYRYLADSGAAQLWNTVGATGVIFEGPFSIYGPLVVDESSFGSPALQVYSEDWVATPSLRANTVDISTLSSAVAALKSSKVLQNLDYHNSYGFFVSSTLPDLLAHLPGRISAGRAQLLAATLLLVALAAIAIIVSCTNLVARGEAQAALLRSRGAPRSVLVSGYGADICILILASGLGAGTETLFGHSGWALGSSTTTSATAWVAALAVGFASALIIVTRASIPPRSADVAASSGRQGGPPGLVRAGLDLALAALAAIALWEAAHAGLEAGSTSGGSGAVLAVALAPALTTLAGAALCGRLITGAARLSERLAERAGSLSTRFAAWELARTPLRYLVPALLCVAAVAGCGYAAGQEATTGRSAHDQASFSVGADASVSLNDELPAGQVETLTGQPGVLAASPELQIGGGQNVVVALDARSAAQVVAIRPDLAGGVPAQRFAAIQSPSSNGIAIPGRPTALGMTVALDAPSTTAPTLTLTIEDADGITYSLPLIGTLAPDGRTRTLSTGDALGPQAAFPLRILGMTLQYTLDPTRSGRSALDVSSLLSGQSAASGSTTFTPIPGAAELASHQWSSSASADLEPEYFCATPPAPMITANPDGGFIDGAGPTAQNVAPSDGGARISFLSGAGLNYSPYCATTPATATIALYAHAPAVIPALASAGYLHANGASIGDTVQMSVGGATVNLKIVGSVSQFPGQAVGASALVIDLGTLGVAANSLDAALPQTETWLLHTRGGAPPQAPPGAVVVTADQVAAGLLDDPLAHVPDRVIALGAPALVLLALLGLLISLLAASRGAASRDMVLAALGTTRPQRAALASILYAAVVLPAVVLGGGLGWVLCRLLIPSFVLAPDGTDPVPSAVVISAEPWTIAAAVLVLAAAVATALTASLRRGDPLALARAGG